MPSDLKHALGDLDRISHGARIFGMGSTASPWRYDVAA
jgi:hypothetical protein